MKPLKLAVFLATSLVSIPAFADKVAVLPFFSQNNVPRPELEQVRQWTREAVTKANHTYATNDEMVSAEATIKDGAADTSQEHIAAGKTVGAAWTLSARVDRIDYPISRMPDGTEQQGYTTYRIEVEACQIGSGRVESVSREILPDEGVSDIAQMLTLLLRPEGIANAQLPWENAGVRKPKPKPKAPPPPPPQVVQPPAAPEKPIDYGQDHPLSLGLSAGVSNALSRPDQARGPSWAMPIGAVVGYVVIPNLELKGNLTTQVVGPRALEVSAGARYALAPFTGTRLYIGPELLVGLHAALGAADAVRFLAHGSAFLAVGITENLQAEIAGDISAALGGSGTLLLGGGTGRFVVRF